ncbi:Hpr(Ser) kinase/phosphatase [Brockia lithotrophica]|uniref:HPr kinase/phosphorylase n=1 Tax=Brockia lithotrophica TaxID=933949 RepID=A0A660L2P8_9BACL|nr:Hpr(Ser) kinase/phosphatase [Brockia lithotrophica]
MSPKRIDDGSLTEETGEPRFSPRAPFHTALRSFPLRTRRPGEPLVVEHLVRRFGFTLVAGAAGLRRPILVSELHRPGLALAGHFAYHPPERVQVLGKTEVSFVADLPASLRFERFRRLLSPETPCVVVAHGEAAPPELLSAAEEAAVPVLLSDVPTTHLMGKLTSFLEAELAPRTTIHGVLVEVYGIGILLTGESGIGKSETALELVKRGHRLVADDAVEIHKTSDNGLVGEAPDVIANLIEIRGLGVLDVMALFGAGAVKESQSIALVIHLEPWNEDRSYDRLGLDETTTRLLDVEVPMVVLPVRPGRNLAVLIEVAAMQFRLKQMGYHSAREFAERLGQVLDEKA